MEKFNPYDFQIKAVQEAVKKNIILVGDTGCGKTMVSVMLIDRLIANNKLPQPEKCKLQKKIFFIVDKVLLVAQQAQVIKDSLCPIHNITVGQYTGGYTRGDLGTDQQINATVHDEDYAFISKASSWKRELSVIDVFVLTAQILLDALRHGFIDMKNDSMLLIFDECHHATKNHPFNCIMLEHYHGIKDPSSRPKIFGMTASPFNLKNANHSEADLKMSILRESLDCYVHAANTTVKSKPHTCLEALEYSLLCDDLNNYIPDIEDDKMRMLHERLKLLKKECGGDRNKVRCIVFVQRIIHVRYVAEIISNDMQDLSDFIKCEFITGRAREGKQEFKMDHKTQKNILDQFRSGEINLLVSTNVTEEGIDVPSCNLVIRFDLFNDLTSYIQSRGRARFNDSQYVIMVNKLDIKDMDFLREVSAKEQVMRNSCKSAFVPHSKKEPYEGDRYTVEKSGASATPNSSVTLLSNYCSTLPRDRYCKVFKPEYILTSDRPECFSYRLVMPVNSPLKEMLEYGPVSSKNSAKQHVSLMAVKRLHELGALDDNLIPITSDKSSLVQEFKAVKVEKILNMNRTIPEILQCNQNHSNFLTELVLVYIYRFVVVNGPPVNFRFGLLTTKLLPDIPSPFCIYAQPGEVSQVCLVKVNRIRIRISTIIDYHREIFSRLYHTNIDAQFENERDYVIIPLTENGMTDHQEIQLNLPKIKFDPGTGLNKVLYSDHSRSIIRPIKMDTTTPLQEKYEFVKKYKSERKINKMCGPEIVLTRSVTKHKTDYLVDRFASLSTDQTEETDYPAPADLFYEWDRAMYENLCLIPCLIWQLEKYLLSEELLTKILKEKEISINLFDRMREATLTPSAGDIVNYERLEFVGDAVLKAAVSTSLYLEFPHQHEGWLSQLKSYMVSNKVLAKSCIDNNLVNYITSERYYFKSLHLPHLKCIKPVDHNKSLSLKTQADVVESITGAYFVTSGFERSLHFLHQIKLPKFRLDLILENKRPQPTNTKPISKNLFKVEKLIKYKFRNHNLLDEALTHASCGQKPNAANKKCYQRLEFIGDAVLDIIITELLYTKYSSSKPGKLTDMRIAMVNNGTYAYLSVRTGLAPFVEYYSEEVYEDIDDFVCEVESNEWNPIEDEDKAPKVLGDIFESIAGAVYVDCGFDLDVVKKIFCPLWKNFMDKYISPTKVRVHPTRKILEMIDEICPHGKYDISVDDQQMDNADYISRLKIHEIEVCSAGGDSKKKSKRELCMNLIREHPGEDNLKKYLSSFCKCNLQI
ncbi:dicer-like protein [Acrasis kona]|uniref:Dicer-like protein n=1 Tax=Acrasis kona TaxID=1008807 RepID=A0AAW2ZH49_9EUKA